jgi:competence protein ComEA
MFLATVALLGAGWRAVRETGAAEPSEASRNALAAQLSSVDSIAAGHRRPAGSSSKGGQLPRPPIDVDRASAPELEILPRVGPALARRIVADRDSLGPFGSLDGLQRVKGIGPAMAAQLAPHVTFSQSRRPTDAATYTPLVLPPEWGSVTSRKRRR